ncbi:complex I subunit 4 family protein [Lihuaxuella thermophila]|uniref:NADH-quinone oxidoreductase subunit M n=1 Tax=Lihuaxuella thermophila TaxID=1173111 RepID=A0A1H8B9X1_9BACL|nr:NADH-quinone oxidoreductase subunit M [Lihuaxuella thermophila]SEM79506.1 NADH-quinone oxidoreductase subunit M [Lihuaxuella thermophila]
MKVITAWLPTLITFLPLIGVPVILCLPRKQTGWHRLAAMLATLPSLLLAGYMYALFEAGQKGMQWFQSFVWFRIPIPDPQVEPWVFHYSMGADGLSMPLVLLTCIVSTLAAAASLYIKERTREYYILLLLLQTGMAGVFLSANFFLFFIFFEITLISMYFLIGIWGYLGKEKAANHFLLYNGLGSGFLLFALVGLLLLSGNLDYGVIQQNMAQLMAHPELVNGPVKTMVWAIFVSLMIAFAIKLPIFPFHSWMLRVHVEAPTPVVMIHSGILLKMGAYGLIRFGLGIYPAFMKEVATLLVILGLVNILYGAILAFVQKELKKVLAYSSVSHMGIILLGIGSLSGVGLQGAVFQAVSHGLISALLFFLVGSLYERTKTTELDELGGLAKSMPLFSGILLVAAMALLGLPGLSGFISEFFAFLGLFKVKPVMAAVGTLGLILAAVYTLRAVLKTTFGPMKQRFVKLTDIHPRETVPMLVFVGLIVLIGVYPDVLGRPMQETLELIVSRIGG